MKEYIKPEVECVDFVTEKIANIGITSGEDNEIVG